MITSELHFSTAGIFSGLNNLQNLTIEPSFRNVCGFTEVEINHYLLPYLESWAKSQALPIQALNTELQAWYGGYYFGKNANTVAIYHPDSLLKAVQKQQLENFWGVSDTPTYIIDQLKRYYSSIEYRLYALERLPVSPDSLGAFDASSVSLSALMFQAGYLTVTAYNAQPSIYYLGYPNHEVSITSQQLIKHLELNFEKTAGHPNTDIC